MVTDLCPDLAPTSEFDLLARYDRLGLNVNQLPMLSDLTMESNDEHMFDPSAWSLPTSAATSTPTNQQVCVSPALADIVTVDDLEALPQVPAHVPSINNRPAPEPVDCDIPKKRKRKHKTDGGRDYHQIQVETLGHVTEFWDTKTNTKVMKIETVCLRQTVSFLKKEKVQFAPKVFRRRVRKRFKSHSHLASILLNVYLK
jgi:hypothetical protein